MEKKFPIECPCCSEPLKVVKLHCGSCETEVSGMFDLPELTRLDRKEQQLIINFVKASGSLKVMAQQMGLSYPTVRNVLDEIIEKIEKFEK